MTTIPTAWMLTAGDDANADKVSYEYDSDYRLTELGYFIYDTGTSDYVVWSTATRAFFKA